MTITSIGHHVDGKPAQDKATVPLRSTKQTGVLSLADRSEVDDVVAVAKRAFVAWEATTPLRRARILNRFLRILEERTDQLAAIISAEHGKVHSDAKEEGQ